MLKISLWAPFLLCPSSVDTLNFHLVQSLLISIESSLIYLLLRRAVFNFQIFEIWQLLIPGFDFYLNATMVWEPTSQYRYNFPFVKVCFMTQNMVFLAECSMPSQERWVIVLFLAGLSYRCQFDQVGWWRWSCSPSLWVLPAGSASSWRGCQRLSLSRWISLLLLKAQPAVASPVLTFCFQVCTQ